MNEQALDYKMQGFAMMGVEKFEAFYCYTTRYCLLHSPRIAAELVNPSPLFLYIYKC